MKRNPNITRWLQEQWERHDALASEHEMQAHEFDEAQKQYEQKGTLPWRIRKKWNQRNSEPLIDV